MEMIKGMDCDFYFKIPGYLLFTPLTLQKVTTTFILVFTTFTMQMHTGVLLGMFAYAII